MLCGHALVAQGNQKDQKDQRWAFWRFVSVIGTVAFAGGILGNFFREVAVQMIEALRTWWGS